MTTVAMENLWTYIQGLNLSRRNKAWLGERLINGSKAEAAQKAADPTLMTMAQLQAKISEAETQYRQGKCHTMLPGESFTDFRRRIGR